MTAKRAADPASDEIQALNEEFYDRQPWAYFQLRCSFLALAASSEDRVREAFADPIQVGALGFGLSLPQEYAYPSPQQQFVAIELEVLLQHAAETVLRLIHAHAEHPPCPWLKMSRLRHHGEFKDWVRRKILERYTQMLWMGLKKKAAYLPG
jgi:hypothetical protein